MNRYGHLLRSVGAALADALDAIGSTRVPTPTPIISTHAGKDSYGGTRT